ncbi:2-dehydro-3-deoxygalactonokinase [Labrenzia sp. PHM005]|uniref:2-dehydro-3-deoxygalactonokinase n=1 Tax=Labrenzia sp. PHM005 TaxID=2590016 RepID=UPI0011400959|nr:2-dehydro-3-deoxygalactonokinase [Labrenzia sp. PHM005]QDG75858.1 2-dehydro-3-deoxygalactonokinase [Labrenzia sp. PHM005]
MTSNADIAWIAADWGTTNLRIWALGADDCPIVHRSSEKGMGALTPDQFEAALLELVEDCLTAGRTTPIIVCGMAGSRQGWSEAPYKTAPCPPPGIHDATTVATDDPRLDVRILPGIKQMSPADVMRGEETQIAGFLASRPNFEGLLCLPGTHTKWAALESGVITRFRTSMTGEVYALLRKQSVLRHGLSTEALDETAFTEAVLEMAQHPERLTGELFGIRASGLVDNLSPQAASGRLSGLLIGAELAAMAPIFDLRQTAILGSDTIAKAYATALTALEHKSDPLDADTLTLTGLTLAYKTHLKEKP